MVIYRTRINIQTSRCTSFWRYREVTTMTMLREWAYPHGLPLAEKSVIVKSIAIVPTTATVEYIYSLKDKGYIRNLTQFLVLCRNIIYCQRSEERSAQLYERYICVQKLFGRKFHAKKPNQKWVPNKTKPCYLKLEHPRKRKVRSLYRHSDQSLSVHHANVL